MEEYHLRRKDKAIVDRKRMLDFLEGQKLVTVALSKDGKPYLFTADYGFDRKSKSIFVHCAKKGKKVDYIESNPIVWGQIMEDIGYVQGECSHNYRTVQFKGKAELVTGLKEKRKALNIMIDQLEEDPEKGKKELIDRSGLRKALIIRIRIEGLSGKESVPERGKRAAGKQGNTEEILSLALSSGVDIAGIADLKNLRGIRTYPKDLLKGYRYGISIAVGLDKYDAYDMEVEGEISYRILRATCAIIANNIRKRGYRAIVPDLDDPVRWKGALYFKSPLSMKAVANAAGLGWIGKSAVFVSYDYGPRVNLGAVITDMPLVAGKPSKNQCGNCSACAKACPVGALTATTFDVYPKDLRKVLQKEKCNEWIERPENKVHGICWECVLACPKRGRNRKVTPSSRTR